jgi:Domain of unknown function (DUF4148)
MIKSIIPALVLATALAAPAFAFAQNTQPLTRAEVKAQLVQLEKAGYVPGADDTTYPQDIQAAEQRVAAQQQIDASSYGASTSGASASGQASIASTTTPQSIYFGH